jgi:hypothetical protein
VFRKFVLPLHRRKAKSGKTEYPKKYPFLGLLIGNVRNQALSRKRRKAHKYREVEQTVTVENKFLRAVLSAINLINQGFTKQVPGKVPNSDFSGLFFAYFRRTK